MSFEAFVTRPAADAPRPCRIVITVPAPVVRGALLALRKLVSQLPADSAIRGYVLGARIEGDTP